MNEIRMYWEVTQYSLSLTARYNVNYAVDSAVSSASLLRFDRI